MLKLAGETDGTSEQATLVSDKMDIMSQCSTQTQLSELPQVVSVASTAPENIETVVAKDDKGLTEKTNEPVKKEPVKKDWWNDDV